MFAAEEKDTALPLLGRRTENMAIIPIFCFSGNMYHALWQDNTH